MKPENTGGNGTPVERDDGTRKGVLGPTDAADIPEYDPNVAQNPAAQGGAGDGSGAGGSGLVTPADLMTPTQAFGDYVTNILLGRYISIKQKQNIKVDREPLIRIYDEIAPFEAYLEVVRSNELYGVSIRFNIVNQDTLKGYIKNLSDVFGTDNLDSLISNMMFPASFKALAYNIPELEDISVIDDSVHWNCPIIPPYIMIAGAQKKARGPLSHIVEEESKGKKDILDVIGVGHAAKKNEFLITHALSTKTLVEMEKRGYGSVAELRLMLNEAIEKYNNTINSLGGQ